MEFQRLTEKSRAWMAWLYFLLFFSNNKVKSGQIGFNWNLHRMLQKNRIHCLRLLTILDKKQHYTNILIRNFVKSKFDFNCCIRWKAIILKTFRQVFSKLCRESNSLGNLFWEYAENHVLKVKVGFFSFCIPTLKPPLEVRNSVQYSRRPALENVPQDIY